MKFLIRNKTTGQYLRLSLIPALRLWMLNRRTKCYVDGRGNFKTFNK